MVKKGNKMTEEHKRKIGLSNIGKNKGMHFSRFTEFKKGEIHSHPQTEETKQKLREVMFNRRKTLGYINSPEAIEKRRLKVIGQKRTQETCNNISKSLMGKFLGKKLSIEHKKAISLGNMGRIITEETMEKMKKTRIKNGGWKVSDEQKAKYKIKRREWACPKYDTLIEVKIQNFLKELNIEFYTHKYIKEIEHGYQCDILIPEQKNISKKLIIECDGDYWHGHWSHYSILTQKQKDAQAKDLIRTNELRDKGYRVLRFWESEIKEMQLEDLQNKLIQMEGGSY